MKDVDKLALALVGFMAAIAFLNFGMLHLSSSASGGSGFFLGFSRPGG